jgi:hypothetical protein
MTFLALVLMVLGAAAARTSSVQVQRELLISATPDAVATYMTNLSQWPTWVAAFADNRVSGFTSDSASARFVRDGVPMQVALDRASPFHLVATITAETTRTQQLTFDLTPSSSGTRVAAKVDRTINFFDKLVSLSIEAEPVIGAELDSSLVALKGLVEQPVPPAPSTP